MDSTWTLRFKAGLPAAAEEIVDGKISRRFEPVWTVQELCRRWRKSRRQVYRYIREGRVRAVGKFLGEWLVEAAEPPSDAVLPGVCELLPGHDAKSLKVRAHRDLILGRVLSIGGKERIRWAFSTYGDRTIKRFVAERGPRDLDPRSLRFWSLYFNLPVRLVSAARAKGRDWGGA
ncbi:MAG: hypothetical protein HY927_02850 [Elusimicrobia bacterium]|nr:hypothetical protein [Elusimicrobiota bacterium]